MHFADDFFARLNKKRNKPFDSRCIPSWKSVQIPVGADLQLQVTPPFCCKLSSMGYILLLYGRIIKRNVNYERSDLDLSIQININCR